MSAADSGGDLNRGTQRSDSKPPKTLDRAAAWASLLTNLLVLPGLGTIIAGQSGGWLQAALSLIGLLMMTGWMGWFVWTWASLQQIPQTTGPYFWTAMLGIALFLAGWTWSMISSLVLIQKTPARK